MIETKKVCRAFPVAGGEPFMALKDVCVRIPEKKLTILRGKSGSGKTTLLNIIGALDAPSSGEVFFDGRNITGLSDKEREKLRRKKIGFVFQSVSLIPMMTVYENVEFALRLSDFKGNRKKRVEECLHLVGLGKRAQHMPQELSGGEQQRVAIARAIAHAPQVLFADEPTAELDTATSLAVIRLFKDLVERQGVTIVMTTHDMSLMDAGDVVYTLVDGSVEGMEEEKEQGQGSEVKVQ